MHLRGDPRCCRGVFWNSETVALKRLCWFQAPSCPHSGSESQLRQAFVAQTFSRINFAVLSHNLSLNLLRTGKKLIEFAHGYLHA